jgi:uncharacterized protein YozE (UPF0346 family)
MTTCRECFEEDPQRQAQLMYVELPEDQIINTKCERGHEVLGVIQTQKWELLLELGAMAYLDGYYREAVSTFAAAYERFLEFYIRAVCHAREIPVEQLNATWGMIKKQSERQLGAFMLLYLLNEKTPPPQPSSSRTEFRNLVTHQGVFPKQTQAFEYMEWVYNFIVEVGRALRAKHEDAAQAVINQALFNASRKVPRRPDKNGLYHSSTTALHTLLNWILVPWGEVPFEQALADLKERKDFFWSRSADEGSQSQNPKSEAP